MSYAFCVYNDRPIICRINRDKYSDVVTGTELQNVIVPDPNRTLVPNGHWKIILILVPGGFFIILASDYNKISKVSSYPLSTSHSNIIIAVTSFGTGRYPFMLLNYFKSHIGEPFNSVLTSHVNTFTLYWGLCLIEEGEGDEPDEVEDSFIMETVPGQFDNLIDPDHTPLATPDLSMYYIQVPVDKLMTFYITIGEGHRVVKVNSWGDIKWHSDIIPVVESDPVNEFDDIETDSDQYNTTVFSQRLTKIIKNKQLISEYTRLDNLDHIFVGVQGSIFYGKHSKIYNLRTHTETIMTETKITAFLDFTNVPCKESVVVVKFRSDSVVDSITILCVTERNTIVQIGFEGTIYNSHDPIIDVVAMQIEKGNIYYTMRFYDVYKLVDVPRILLH